MTRSEAVQAVETFDTDQQVRWMIFFGCYLTIEARGVYAQKNALTCLMGVNEIHHHVYARIRDLRRGHDWPVGDFLQDTFSKAQLYGIAGEVSAAMRSSIEGVLNLVIHKLI